MREDFVTQLRLQLRDAAEREARRGPLTRALRALRWNAGAPTLMVGAAVAAAAVIALVVLPFLRDDNPVPAGGGLRVVAQQPLVQQGAGLEPAFSAVWAADKGTGEILRLDPRTRAVQARIVLGGEPTIVAGEDALWAIAAGKLQRIDPATERVTGKLTLPLPEGTGFPVPGRGAMWVLDGVAMRRVDLERMVIDRRVRLIKGGFLATGFAFDANAIYVQRSDGVITSYDAGSGARLGAVRIDPSAHLEAVASGRLLLGTATGVVAIDPATGRRAWTRELGAAKVNGIREDGTEVWVQAADATTGRDRLWRIDAGDGRVLGSLSLPEFGVAGMAPVGAAMWLLSPGGALTVVAPG
jgi:outer membrane protein assembly factor BamB